jgi:hypothetical protein
MSIMAVSSMGCSAVYPIPDGCGGVLCFRRDQPLIQAGVMTVRLASVSYTSGDGATTIPSYLASPDGEGPHPAVLTLRGVAGPDDGYIEIARRLAEWGYVTLLHGWKVRGTDPPDAPVYDDLAGALTFLNSVGAVDQARVAVPTAARTSPRPR